MNQEGTGEKESPFQSDSFEEFKDSLCEMLFSLSPFSS